MYKYLLVFLLLFTNTNVISGTIDPNVPDSKYIKYAEGFPFIGKICGKYKDGNRFCASAVAINSDTILTAAHVVDNAEICTFTINDNTFCVYKILVHKDYHSDKFGYNDIAVARIDGDLGLKFYPQLYEDRDEIGKICCMGGYGITGTFNTGGVISDNKKRAGSNKIDSIDRELLLCSPSLPGDKNRTSLEFLIASGDSGGGLFIDGKLAGINSCVMAAKGSPNSKYGCESGHTRISSYIGWIKENIR